MEKMPQKLQPELFEEIKKKYSGNIDKYTEHVYNTSVFVNENKMNAFLEKVAKRRGQKDFHISGIIVTGHSEIQQSHIDFFVKEQIPVIITELDTYESVVKISRMEVKINTRTPWKIVKAVALFRQHINIEPVVSRTLSH